VKDQLLVIIDALLAAKAALREYAEGRGKNVPQTIERLERIVYDPKVAQAMDALLPEIQAPSLEMESELANIIPHERETEVHADNALWRKK